MEGTLERAGSKAKPRLCVTSVGELNIAMVIPVLSNRTRSHPERGHTSACSGETSFL